jgi:divalent metal cation (Fe/Co/Zn/Cd) transporter
VENADQDSAKYQKDVVAVQLITILWMCAEALAAIVAAVRAHSVALWGFGADSAIELVSAVVVLLRFKKITWVNETTAARSTGLLLFALAAFIMGTSILALTRPRFRPGPSYWGIALLIVAGIVMSWLAARKRRLAARTNSTSLKADAVQSAMCAYLACIALGGLVLNAAFKVSWADPAAALLLLPIILREAWEAIQG